MSRLVLDEVEARLPIPGDVLVVASSELPSGAAWWSPMHRVVLVREGLSVVERRWALAHEAAHIVLGHHGGMGPGIEAEADELAVELLRAAQGRVVGLPVRCWTTREQLTAVAS